ncbi:MAG TPA: hypothetical protein VK986_09835 [Tepidisphaeraceae bacterium]|nr:hypothetical protein [Tepidisphaeraceae bacterium]
MMHSVTIENDALRMEVWPQLGGKVSSLIDKADGFDLLFNYPAELPEEPQYDLPYHKGWYAGWDECFPAVGPSRYAGYPYDGIPVPDHGEVWSLPTVAAPMRHGITTVSEGLRFGYRFTRALYLDGSAVVADYTVHNLAPFAFRFVWATHPLLSMRVPVVLDLPQGTTMRLSHDAAGTEIGQEFAWPVTAGGDDLARPNDLRTGAAWKVYSHHPIGGPLTVRYPSRGRRLTVQYSSDDSVAAYWGVWVNTGGWGTHRHFGVEPTTGRHDQIDRSIKDHSAGTVPPLGKKSWTVRLAVG